MTADQFFNRTERLFKDLANFGKKVPFVYKGLELSSESANTSKLLPIIAKKDWPKLISICRSQLRQLKTQQKKLQQAQTTYNGFFRRLYSLRNGFKQYYQLPKNHPKWNEVCKKIIDDLKASGVATTDIRKYLKKAGNRGGLNAFTYYSKQISNTTELLQYAVQRNITKYLYYYEATLLGMYNMQYMKHSGLQGSVLQQINALNKAATRQQDKIYRLLRAGKLSELASYLREQSGWLIETIDSKIIPILSYCYAKKAAANHTSSAHGARAMAAGNLFQTLLYSLGVCTFLRWQVVWHPESELIKDYLEKARALANSPLEWPGEHRAIEKLVSNPNANHKKEVIVEGRITSMKIKHVAPKKVLSTAQIVDTDNNRINLVLPYIKLDSGGLVNNSYARVQGKFIKSHPGAGGKPAISVGRWPLRELSDTSWNAWMRYQMRNILEIPSHNLVMAFSLEPGIKGAMNPIIYEVTASEPDIFTTQKIV